MKPPLPKTPLHPVMLLVPALWIIWAFGYQSLGERLMTDVNGTIIESRDIPWTHAPRYVTDYRIHAADGADITYISGPTDGYLPRSMPVGTEIRKQKWQLSYEKDGKTVNDFPISFNAGMLGIALGFIVWSFLQWRRLRK